MMIATHVCWRCNCLHRRKVAKTVRGSLTAQSQPEGAGEPETNTSVTQQEEQADTIDGKAIADYMLDIDYKPEGSDPEIKLVNQVQEEEDPNAKHAKMEISC